MRACGRCWAFGPFGSRWTTAGPPCHDRSRMSTPPSRMVAATAMSPLPPHCPPTVQPRLARSRNTSGAVPDTPRTRARTCGKTTAIGCHRTNRPHAAESCCAELRLSFVVISAVISRVLRTIRSEALYITGNYLVNLLDIFPPLVIPLIIVNRLGAAAAAYYYLAFMLVNLLNSASFAIAQSSLCSPRVHTRTSRSALCSVGQASLWAPSSSPLAPLCSWPDLSHSSPFSALSTAPMQVGHSEF